MGPANPRARDAFALPERKRNPLFAVNHGDRCARVTTLRRAGVIQNILRPQAGGVRRNRGAIDLRRARTMGGVLAVALAEFWDGGAGARGGIVAAGDRQQGVSRVE